MPIRADLVKWRVVYTRQARRDAKRLAAAGLRPKAEALLGVMARDCCAALPPFVNLAGDLAGTCSRRIDFHHRLVYQVLPEIQTVKVVRMWTRCE